MMDALIIEPQFVMFCDDVRKEETGKFIFIGVYTQGMAIASYPYNVVFNLYIHGKYIGFGQAKFSVEIVRHRDRKVLFAARGWSNPQLTIMPKLKFEITTRNIEVNIEQEELLLATFTQDGQPQREIGSLWVSASTDPFPTASPPPSERSPLDARAS